MTEVASQPKRSVLITGCGRGIGLAVAEALAETDSYLLYGLTRTIPDPANPKSSPIEVFQCDLADPAATHRAAKHVLEVSQGVDILISNAGIGLFRPIDEMTLDEWQRVVAINLTATYVLVHCLLPHMKRRNFGRIVTICSDAAHRGYADAAAYCASKAGLRLLSDCVRKEVEQFNIHVTTIIPGRVDTYFNAKRPGDRPQSLRARAVAAQVVFALSQDDGCEIEHIALNSAFEKHLH